MTCPSCQAPSRPGERRCVRCGQALPPSCLACGEPVGEGEELCASCGTERMPLAPIADTGELFRPASAEETQVVAAPYPLAPRTVGQSRPRARVDAAAAAAQHGSRFIALVGPPGSGKSRLLGDLVRGLAERAPGTRAFIASAAHGPLAYAAFARLLAARFGLSASDTVESVRAKVSAGVAAVVPDARKTEVTHLLAHVLRADFPGSPVVEPLADTPRQLEARLFLALRRFLAADAARGPLLFALDDLEQAGPESINLLHYLAAGLGGAPILLACAFRPELYQAHPSFGAGETGLEVIEVSPLTEDEAEALLYELCRPAGEPPVGLVIHARRLGRTPRALVELTRWLVEADVIARSDGGWALDAARLAGLTLPASPAEVTAARLRLLPPVERDILEKAAAVGERFWLDSLVAIIRAIQLLAGSPDGPTLAEIAATGDRTRLSVALALARLGDRAFITEQPTSIPGAREYRFAYPVLRDVVLAAVPPDVLRRYHLWVAGWLELRPDGRAEDSLEEIGRHLELAGDGDQAAACYRRAGDAARRRYENDKAIRLYGRALAGASGGNLALRIHVQHDLGSVHQLKGDFDAAIGAFERMLRLTWVASSRAKAAVAMNKLGRVWRAKGDLGLALNYLERGHALFVESGDERGVASSLDDIGHVLYLLGRTDEALAKMQEGLTRRDDDGDPRSIAYSLSNLGAVHKDRGDLAEAERCHARALVLRESAGDRAGTVLSRTHLAVLVFERGDVRAARASLEGALALAERIGALPLEALVLAHLGEVALAEGKSDEARSRLEAALTLARELDDRRVTSEAARQLGLLELAAGNPGRARELIDRALGLAEKAGLRDQVGRALLALGQAQTATLFADVQGADDNLVGAESSYQRAVDIFRSLGNRSLLARALEQHGRHRLERGDGPGGRALLEEARTLQRTLGRAS
jgi:tetratricopeptide (TPR) repeat protein